MLRYNIKWITSDECRRKVGRPTICYAEVFATTIRAISGLSRQTPSLRMARLAGSKTCDLTKSSTARSTRVLSGSNKSNMNFDDPSLPSRLIPIVGLRQCDVAAEIADYFSLLRAVRKSILDGQRALFRPAVTPRVRRELMLSGP